MNYKKSSLVVFFVLLAMFLAACQEQENVIGPAGNTGTQTSIGTQTKTAPQFIIATQYVSTGNSKGSSQAIIVSQEVTPEMQKIMDLQAQLDKIMATGNVANCSEIKDHTYNTSCQVYMLAAKAKSKTDTKVCDAGTTTEVKDLCKKYVEQNK